MNCWKTINFSKEYGTQRLLILSFLTMLVTFVFLYVPATYIFVSSSLNDKYFILFLACLSLVYPIHKVCHYIPLMHLGKKIKKIISFKHGCFPSIQVRVIEPISKWMFLIALIMPFIFINSVLLIGAYFLHQYIHYFTILLAFHIGICVPDFIRAKTILAAPNKAYVEENEDGFEILISKYN